MTAFGAGYAARKKTTAQLDAEATLLTKTPPLVNAAKATRAPSRSEVILPGSITPITEAYLFARAAGYLKRRYVDIGHRVRSGQLLAEIDAPDMDQQVTQAQAGVAQSEGQLGQAEATLQQLIATRDLANVTWKRYQVLTASGAVSRQDGDTQSTASKTAEANVTAGEKNVRAAQEFAPASKATLHRLITLQSYEKVAAPFAGVVTSRNVDDELSGGSGIAAGRQATAGVESHSDQRAGRADSGVRGAVIMLQMTPQMRILVAVEAVDFRKGIDSLAELCRAKLNADPFSG